MTYRMEMTVILDPVKDAEIVDKYDKDAGWVRVGDSTNYTTFKLINEFNATSVYLASNKGGKA